MLTVVLVVGFAVFVFAQNGQGLAGLSEGLSSDYYHALIGTITGNWQGYGQLFTTLQGQWFLKAFLIIIIAVPGYFGFQMIRGAGLVSLSPVLAELSHGNDQGRFLSVSRIVSDTAILRKNLRMDLL